MYNNDKNARYKNPEYLYQEFIINGKSVQQIADENNTTRKAVTWQLYINGIKKNGNKISKEQLEDLYVKQNLSIEDTARALNTNSRLVSRYLDNYGIQKQFYKYNPVYDNTYDAEWIDLYVNRKFSAYQIAKMYNTNHNLVISHLQHNGIETRNLQEAQRTVNGNYYMHPDLKNPDALRNLHYNYHYSIGVIADMYRCDIRVIKTCFNNLGIQMYNSNTYASAPPALYKDHYFEQSLTQLARAFCKLYLNPFALQRDQYRCRVCGSTENLEVHHSIIPLNKIIYICADLNPQYSISEDITLLFEILKQDPLFLDMNNLSTLCSKCHHKVHKIGRNIIVNQQPTYN